MKNSLSSLYNRFAKASLRRRVITVIVLLVVIGLPVYLLFGNRQQQPQYQTAQVQRGTLVTSVTGSGNVSAANSSDVTTTASGIVNKVYVQQGDTVTQGETLATITLDQTSQQKQAAAWSSYLSAVNTFNSAKADMNSLQSALFKANQAFVTDAGTPNPDTADPKYIEERADWLQAESNYNNQAGVINQSQAAVSSAWLAYQQISSTITAPSSGTLTSFSLTPGMAIGSSSSSGTGSSSSTSSTSSTSQSLGTIAVPGGQTEASVDLSEVDAPHVHSGQKVTMSLDAFPNQTFTGSVSSVDTAGVVSSGVTNYPVTITFDTSPQNIYPNMTVNATIITHIYNNVLTVPTTAIQTLGGQTTVRVLKNGQIQTVSVQTGASNDTDTEIISGLNEGDTVIIGVSPTGSGTQTTSPFGGGFGGRGGVILRGRGG